MAVAVPKTSSRTGEQFLEALNDGRRVFINGEQIDNVATHPKTAGYSKQLARFYDLHHDPELLDVLTYVDEDGIRRQGQWFLPKNKQELAFKRRYHETIVREIGFGQFGRTPDANATISITFIDDPDPWTEHSVGTEGKVVSENLINYWNLMKAGDLNVPPAVIDSQPNRSEQAAYHESPDLRVIERNDAGIVVRGVKAVATGVVWGDRLLVGVYYRPGMEPDQIAFFHVPVNAEGLTMVCREPLDKPDGADVDHPLASLGDELEGMVIFDNVFIPWGDVFHLGNPEHAKLYPQRLFDFLHWQDLTRQVVKAELMVGLSILMADSIGTLKIPAIQIRLSDLVRFREALLAHLIASEDTGFMSPGGMYRPNNRFYDFGRAYYLEHAPKFIHEVLDLAGRGTVITPMDGDWEHPEIGEWLKPLMRGRTTEDERLRILRVMRDAYTSEWAQRNALFDNFNGTPLTATRLLTMNRTEYHPDGPLTVLARQACDLPLAEGQRTHRDEAPAYIQRIDAETF